MTHELYTPWGAIMLVLLMFAVLLFAFATISFHRDQIYEGKRYMVGSIVFSLLGIAVCIMQWF